MWPRATQSRIRLAANYAILAVVVVGDAAIVAWALATNTADIMSLVGTLVMFDLAAYVYVQIPFGIAYCIRGERGERRLHAQRLAYVLDGDPDAGAKYARAKPRWYNGLRRCGRARPWSTTVPTIVAGHWQDTVSSEEAPPYTIHIDQCRRLAKGLYEIRGTGHHTPYNVIVRGYVNRNNVTGETRLAWASAHVMTGGFVASYRNTDLSLEHKAVVDDTRRRPVIVGALHIVNDDVDDGSSSVANARYGASASCRFVLHRVGIEP
ncbi:hypothetical protein pmac_cds_317 [Pandoravirus macleodensis]|uniref:Uncharacterized protein n=1 Tax=Pandoravirus macleodensis TaxID=2107707 RepID=A0A2U7UF67_9VIRU|nr:hypothetical protein pmac_cds_317 [Pandoravirus macleodensis]AVK77005.1 hypothetical protein pmac_cds_317 [Pandoravirus macleodensis]